MTLRVNIEHLVESGVAVTGHGEDVATAHAQAADRIEAAMAGWQGTSAAALAVLSQQWAATTSALLSRMSDHAQGLHTCAQTFAEMERRNTEALTWPGRSADAITADH